MSLFNTALNLSKQDEASFIAFFLNNYGLNIHNHQLINFRKTIHDTCIKHNLATPKQLLDKINSHTVCIERSDLIEKITVDESYFFRDDLQIDFLKNVFLPELIAGKRAENNLQIRIWSAGCSTGQEIYTIAILLHQLLPDYAQWNLHLIGTDINYQALARATTAEYSTWAIRTDNNFIQNSGYFSFISEDCYRLSPTIKQNVKFSYLNLAEDTFPSIMSGICSLDLILCRNVFIYFDSDTIKKTIVKFSESLHDEGCLLLSTTDPLNIKCPDLYIQKNNDVLFFKKISSSFVAPSQVNSTNFKKNERGDTLTSTSQNPVTETPQSSAKLIKEIINQLSVADWTGALEKIEHALSIYPENSDLHQFKAKCLTNAGQMLAAKEACERSIFYDTVEPHSYLLYGLILLQLGLMAQAETAFRQTIFLNHTFMEAHYQLGRILLTKGHKKAAIKSIKNAIQLANSETATRAIHNVMFLTYSSFETMMRNELIFIEKELQTE